MRKSSSDVDRMWYNIACIVTCGVVYLIRLVLSEAIRQAIDD